MVWHLEGTGREVRKRRPTEVALFRRKDGKELCRLVFHGKLYVRKRVKVPIRLRSGEDLDKRFEIKVRPAGWDLIVLELVGTFNYPVQYETKMPIRWGNVREKL